MSREYNIGIIGLGIAGAATASLLARYGHSVTLFERAQQVGPAGAGLVLQPSGQAALKRMELLDQVIGNAESLAGLDAMLPDGKPLVKLRYSDIDANCCGYGVHRGELFGVLHAAAEAAGADIRLGSEIADYSVQNGQVSIASVTGESYGPFDFLVVSDGSLSRIGARIQQHRSNVEYNFGAVWLLGRNTQVRGILHQVISDTTRLLGLLPIGGDRCTLFWGVRKDAIDALEERGYAVWRDEVLKLCPLAEETLDSAESFKQTTFTTYRHNIPARPYNQHVICLGDAAHAMSPHLGQGANLALTDAVSFADSLEAAAGFEDACINFYAARKSTIRYYGALSRVLTPFFQSDYRVLGWGRNAALPVMCSIPTLRREMTRAMAGEK